MLRFPRMASLCAHRWYLVLDDLDTGHALEEGTVNPVPEYIGKYKSEREIGQGGFAVVYKAKDPTLNRDVAIKILRPGWVQDPKMVRRFYREAQSAATLRHPHIVTIYEIGEFDNGQTYIVMEYLPGRSLAEILQKEAILSRDLTLEVLGQVAEALDYLHVQNLVHRDVSPKNIMVEHKPGGRLHCVLTDFGLVKVLVNEDTLTSGPLGTVEYMAPEQIVASRQSEIGPATDIYAMGVMAYRMLTGSLPFGGNPACVLISHLQDEPPDPAEVCEDISPQVSAVLLRALVKEPSERYASAGEMVSELVRAMEALPYRVVDARVPSYAPAEARPGHIVSPEIPQTMRIPAGFFWMGSDERDAEADPNEKPQHREYLPEYEIAKYPVTNAQYQVFVHATGHPPPAHWQDRRCPQGRENHPAVNVSYQDAVDYCRWLGQGTSAIFRLPTEYEWEKAARGGEPDMRRYPWGETWCRGYCNSMEEGWGDTTLVHQYEPHNWSPYGVVDLVGNVWEWTDSLYRPYPHSSHYSPLYSTAYVVRGGSWRNNKKDARIQVRGRYKPDVCRAYLGFRIARQIDTL